MHGDKPVVTPHNTPHPPRKPYFGSTKNRLENRNMEVTWDDLKFVPMIVDGMLL